MWIRTRRNQELFNQLLANGWKPGLSALELDKDLYLYIPAKRICAITAADPLTNDKEFVEHFNYSDLKQVELLKLLGLTNDQIMDTLRNNHVDSN